MWKKGNTFVLMVGMQIGAATIANIWKHPKCPSVDEWIKQPWDIYTREYYLAVKKEENVTLCDSMDGPGEHYAK